MQPLSSPASSESASLSEDSTIVRLQAERDRLLRENLFLRTGQMVGGVDDDLNAAARLAEMRLVEIQALRGDLARTVEITRLLRPKVDALETMLRESEGWERRCHQLESEIDALYESAGEREADFGRVSAHLAGASARCADIESSTSWKVTAPLRAVSGRMRR